MHIDDLFEWVPRYIELKAGAQPLITRDELTENYVEEIKITYSINDMKFILMLHPIIYQPANGNTPSEYIKVLSDLYNFGLLFSADETAPEFQHGPIISTTIYFDSEEEFTIGQVEEYDLEQMTDGSRFNSTPDFATMDFEDAVAFIIDFYLS